MGRIICPNGTSVHNHQLDNIVPFEFLVKDILTEFKTDEHKAKCINLIAEVGVFSYGSILSPFLKNLLRETESEIIKTSCRNFFNKTKKKKKKQQLEYGYEMY